MNKFSLDNIIQLFTLHFKQEVDEPLKPEWVTVIPKLQSKLMDTYNEFSAQFFSMVGLQLLMLAIVVGIIVWNIERRRLRQIDSSLKQVNAEMMIESFTAGLPKTPATLDAEIHRTTGILRATHDELSELSAAVRATRNSAKCNECAKRAKEVSEITRHKRVDRATKWLLKTHKKKYSNGDNMNGDYVREVK